jgi:hypothetical protein
MDAGIGGVHLACPMCGQSVKLTTHFHLLLISRIRGALHPLFLYDFLSWYLEHWQLSVISLCTCFRRKCLKVLKDQWSMVRLDLGTRMEKWDPNLVVDDEACLKSQKFFCNLPV